MIVGYARTSTYEQQFGLEAQIDALKNEKCERIFQERISSRGKRPELDAALQFVREGDILIVTKLDRLARSVPDLWKLVSQLDEKKVSLRILNIALDTKSATGRLMLSMLAAVAEFERDIMLERQKDGIAKARSANVRFGRPPRARAQLPMIKELRSSGLSPSEIANQLSISRASIYRLLGSENA